MYKLCIFVVRGILSPYCSWLSDLKNRQREELFILGISQESCRRRICRHRDTENIDMWTASCRYWCNTEELMTFWPNKNELSKEQCLPSAQVQGRQIPTDMLDAPWCSHGECPLRDCLQGFTNHNINQLCHWGMSAGSFCSWVLWSWGQVGFLH